MVVVAFFAGALTRGPAGGAGQGEELLARRVVIEYEAPGSAQVGIVGDFNEWGRKEVAVKSTKAEGRWVFELDLMPGRYQYALVVDGKKWVPDPNATGIIPDGFGGMNSVLYIHGGEEYNAL